VTASRIRIDRLLVERGLFETRAKAQAAIAAGRITANNIAVRKASEELSADAVLCAEPAHPWVSRGGIKLAAALDRFAGSSLLDPSGRVCLDVGASTGGFTEVLLARGARQVYAVDVGREQLHPRLRLRPDVLSLEATDIRSLEPALFSEPPTLVTVDVSFISLRLVLPPALGLAARAAGLLALVKPQFEAGPGRARKGIVRDPRVHAAVCEEACSLVASLGWTVVGTLPSPIPGAGGNRELFVAATRR
jgi:23S rRNA (cytidine1920-2'-O)/16S rRNA (cytidine1409-2'-O)-methyltransferase